MCQGWRRRRRLRSGRFNVTDPVVQEVFANEVIPFRLLTNNHAGDGKHASRKRRSVSSARTRSAWRCGEGSKERTAPQTPQATCPKRDPVTSRQLSLGGWLIGRVGQKGHGDLAGLVVSGDEK